MCGSADGAQSPRRRVAAHAACAAPQGGRQAVARKGQAPHTWADVRSCPRVGALRRRKPSDRCNDSRMAVALDACGRRSCSAGREPASWGTHVGGEGCAKSTPEGSIKENKRRTRQRRASPAATRRAGARSRRRAPRAAACQRQRAQPARRSPATECLFPALPPPPPRRAAPQQRRSAYWLRSRVPAAGKHAPSGRWRRKKGHRRRPAQRGAPRPTPSQKSRREGGRGVEGSLRIAAPPPTPPPPPFR